MIKDTSTTNRHRSSASHHHHQHRQSMQIKNSEEAAPLSLLPQQFLPTHPTTTTSPKSAPSLSPSSANSRALLPNGAGVVPQRRKKRKMSSSSSSWSLSSAARITASSHTSLSNRLLSLNHFVISSMLLLFLLFSPSPASAAEFNIEKLQEYNSLATCIGQIHKDFELCNTRGAEKAKSFNVNLGEEWNRRLQCCGMWKLRDCWMRAAQAKCSKAQAEQVFKLPQLFLPDLASSCTAYTPESGKCSIPMWLMASVVGAGLALLLCCFGGTCWCVRRVRARAVRRSALHRRHAPKQHGGGGKGLGAVSTSLISSSSVVSASNGGNGLQLMPSSLANGGSGGGAKTKKNTAALNGKLSRPKNGYANGGSGLARVTINIEEATSDEVKSLNAVTLDQPPPPPPTAASVV